MNSEKAQNTEVEISRPEVLTVRMVISGEGMLPLVFILPAVIAFFFLLAVPSI